MVTVIHYILWLSSLKTGILKLKDSYNVRSTCAHFHFVEITSNAKAILVVEKDATYQKLLDGDILRKLFPIIMITVCGLYKA